MAPPTTASLRSYSYERSAIQDWLDRGNTLSPLTGLELEDRQLIPNLTLRRAMAAAAAGSGSGGGPGG